MGLVTRRNGEVVIPEIKPRRTVDAVTNLTSDKLAELISQRHTCLVQLHKLGVKQSELVSSGEIGSLLRLLSVKNQLIVALQAIEQQLGPFHDQDPEARVWPNSAARERCARQATECQTLLKEIMQMERDNEQKMTERRDQVASQLQAAQSATTARRAYQAQQRYSHRSHTGEMNITTATPLDLHTEA
jgi:hypothetical protein